MPLYEYQCLTCGKRTEVLQRFEDAPLAACPACGGEVKKMVSSPAFQFKGTGWYVTDYAGKKGGAGGSGGKSEGKGEGGGGDSSEAGKAEKVDKGDKADKPKESSSSESKGSGSSGSSGSSGKSES
jgi:putative FmdB family regulatory protein